MAGKPKRFIINDLHKAFIVDALACFMRPAQVIAEMKETFPEAAGAEIARSTVLRYDPTRVQGGQELGQKWKEIFWERRKQFLENKQLVPIANPSYRLVELQKLYEAAAYPTGGAKPNRPLAKDLLETAEKFDGGYFTNKRDITSNGETVRVVGIEVIAPVMPAKGDDGDGPGGADPGREDTP